MEIGTFLHQYLSRMYYTTTNTKKILKAAEALLWFDQKDMAEFLTGRRRRVKFVEYQLPRLVEREKLKAERYERRLVYTKRSGHTDLIPHGLTCTRILLKLLKARAGEVVPESFFKRATESFGLVPDGGLLYPSGLLLFEYCTADNFGRTYLMKRKLGAYRENIHRIESLFDKEAIILFILEAKRFEVIHFAEKRGEKTDNQFFFVDLASFLDVSDGDHLSSPIYIWAPDGGSYQLTDDSLE